MIRSYFSFANALNPAIHLPKTVCHTPNAESAAAGNILANLANTAPAAAVPTNHK